MIVTAGAVDVTVLFFFGGCVADFDDFHLELQRLTGKRVVAVDRDGLIIRFDHSHHSRTVRRLRLELSTDGNVNSVREIGSGNWLDQAWVVFAVAVLRSHFHCQFRTGFLPGQRLFQTRNNVPCPVQIGQRLPSFGRVENLAFFVGQGVINTDNFFISGLHNRTIFHSNRVSSSPV